MHAFNVVVVGTNGDIVYDFTSSLILNDKFMVGCSTKVYISKIN